MLRFKTLAIAGTLLLAVFPAIAAPAGVAVPQAEAASVCQVFNQYPLIQPAGGDDLWLYGRAGVFGDCSNDTVTIYLCELLDFGGNWYCGGKRVHAGIDPSENGTHYSLSVYADCSNYSATGQIASGYRLNGGTLNIGLSYTSWICN